MSLFPRRTTFALAAAFVVAVLLAAAGSASAATLVVTSQDDADDGTCDVPHCSLREAIAAANATGAADELVVAVNETITPQTPLPPVTETLHISARATTGRCFSDAAQLRLDGDGADFDGLVFAPGSDGSRICMVNVRGFNAGIELESDGNAIRLSRLGTSPDGKVADPNLDAGVVVQGDDNLIGGSQSTDRNVISGNTISGIFVAEASGTRIEGNLIGTDVSGTAAVSNGTGVLVAEEASDTTVGGTELGTRNVISGNLSDGVQTSDGRVVGNHIGLDAAGTAQLPNGDTGVTALAPIQIGGTTDAERNLIAGHEGGGVLLRAAATVQGNWIGLAPDGTNLQTDSTGTGIRIGEAVSGAVVGGVQDGAGNIVTNTPTGIAVAGDRARIEGNTIGLDDHGDPSELVPDGIRVEATAEDTKIGGETPGARNTISGNSLGVHLEEGIRGTVVEGNFIGTDEAGSEARPNESGIAIGTQDVGAPAPIDIRIGGTRPAQRNVISGNGVGVSASAAVADALIQGNFIGVAADGSTALGNEAGLDLGLFDRTPAAAQTPGDGFVVGGTAAGAGNRIAHNTGGDGFDGASAGVVLGETANGVTILGNEIFANDDLGIDYDDDLVSPNGTVDPDRLPPFPLLTSAGPVQTGGTAVQGSITNAAGHDVRIEFFSSPSCDPSGHGEGQVPLGALSVRAAGGKAAFAARVATAQPGHAITATATDLDLHRTSEFSRCVVMSATPTPPEPAPQAPPAGPAPAPAGQPAPGPVAGVPGIVVPPVVDDSPRKPPCAVPRLAGLSLAKAKRRLATAGCKAGKITKPRRPRGGRRRLVVRRTGRKPGSTHAAGTRVSLTLKWVRVRR